MLIFTVVLGLLILAHYLFACVFWTNFLPQLIRQNGIGRCEVFITVSFGYFSYRGVIIPVFLVELTNNNIFYWITTVIFFFYISNFFHWHKYKQKNG